MLTFPEKSIKNMWRTFFKEGKVIVLRNHWLFYSEANLTQKQPIEWIFKYSTCLFFPFIHTSEHVQDIS